MRYSFSIILVALIALNAFADSSTIILQRARDVAHTTPTGGIAPESGQHHAGPSTTPATSQPATSATPTLPPGQTVFINELSYVKTNDTHRLATDLMNLAQGTQKPSTATVDKLANDLARAIDGHTFTTAQRGRIAQDIQTVFSGPASMTPARSEAFIVDVPLVLKAGGVESTLTAPVGDDLRAARKEVTQPASPIATGK